MASAQQQPRSTKYDAYDYDPATGSYTRAKPPTDKYSSSSSAPPPRPPKELSADHDHHRRNYVRPPITKETQSGLTELEGDSLDMTSLSMEDTASRKSPSDDGGGEVAREKKRRDKDKSRPLDQPRSRSRSRSRSRRRKVRVLSLDGGGIRGYSTLVILSELMHQVYVQTHGCAPRSPSELPRPCDYFDLIGGTGTGGLIALMLGRMRMDVESCKEYYVELTRFVFITDKTLMGVPYGKTLFKASRLEDAIRHVVRQSTRFESEKIIPHSPSGPQRIQSRRSDSWKRRAAAFGPPIRTRTRSNSPPRSRSGGGNAEAPLFDDRKGRCRTFVTATYIGSAPGTPPVLLRTYPSPTESVPSYNCTIWQAGRATSATLAAFKPIAIGQNIFLDEGAGQYNPAVAVLEEARRNEFPDCDIGVFISIGTGKRPDVPGSSSSSDSKNRHHHHHHRHHRSTDTVDKPLWWEGVISTPSFDSFAAARHRLLSKIDDSERIHRYLLDGPDSGDGQPGLTKFGVSRENYYRFNVEVGVGEFAMNEWNRLAEVSTSTRRYLVMRETTKFVREAAGKLVDIEKEAVAKGEKVGFEASRSDCEISELPAVVTPPPASAPQWQQQERPASPPMSTGSRGRNPTTIPILTEKITVSPPTPSPQPPPPPPQIQYSSYDQTGRAEVAAEDIYPNPEIRITSPTTVAGGSERGSFSDDNDDGDGGRRRRREEGEGEIERRRRKRREKAAAAAAAAAAAGGGGGGGGSGSGGRRRR